MKTKVSFIVVLLSCFISCPGAFGQAQQPASASPTVVVIDINHIYQSHVRFKEEMKRMEGEVQRTEATLKQKFEEVQRMGEQLKEFSPDSPDYRRMEAEITKRQAEFNAEAAIQKKDILKKEAAIYYDVYQEIQREVEKFAKTYGIKLVIRFSREKVEPNDRKSVLSEINKAVVYHAGLDITDHVLNELNRRAGQANNSTPISSRPGVPRRPRQ